MSSKPEKNLKRAPRVKIEDNLFKVADSYVYRRGDFEQSLGPFPNDAKAKEAKRIFETIRSRIGSEAFDWRVKNLFPEYIEEREVQVRGGLPGRRKISPRTIEEIKRVWEKHLRKFFAHKRLSDIDAVLWNDYCRKAKVADLTNHRKIMGTFLRWCEQSGKLKFVPNMKIPQVTRRKRKTLTPDQIKLVLEHSSGSLLLFVAQYLFMGIRRGEQVQMAWKHVDLNERWILIPDETTRTRTGRVIPMNSFVHELLSRRQQEQKDQRLKTPWVFPKATDASQHMTECGPNKAWQNMMISSGLNEVGIQPHDLRATYEHYANKRSDFTDTQREKMAGASIQTQRRIYLHGFQADDLRGLEEVVQIEGLELALETKLLKAPEFQSAGENTGTGKTRRRTDR